MANNEEATSLTQPRPPLGMMNQNGQRVATVKPQSKLPVPSSAKKRPRGSDDDDDVSFSETQVKESKRSKIAPPTPLPQPKKKPVASRPGATKPRGTMTRSASATSVRNTGRPKPAAVVNKPLPPARTRTTAITASQKTTTTAARPSYRTTTRAANNTATTSQSGGNDRKPKRAAWDYKGRLEDMNDDMKQITASNSNLQQTVFETLTRVANLEKERQQLEGTVVQKERVQTEAEERNRRLERETRDKEEELDNLKRKMSRIERDYESLEGDYSAARQEINGYKTTISQMTADKMGIESERNNLQRSLEIIQEQLRIKTDECRDKGSKIEKLNDDVKERNEKLREQETIRRTLHNTIQELKGNIRVFCRVRPLVTEELENGVRPVSMNYPDIDSKMIELEKPAEESSVGGAKKRAQTYEFNFDKVFNPESCQQEVFEEISQLVQSALDGYNVCIFAYGQTGSGKTYTMEGPQQPSDESRGMIPRAAEQIFDFALSLEEKGWKYDMNASFLEIYNETIRDLLGPSNSKEKHEIKLTGSKGTEVEVTNITVTTVKSEQQIHDLLCKAATNRAVAATNCNERSSRSHSVFILKLHGKNGKTGEECEGVLNLVDLAGSERLDKSDSKGDRLKETKNINKSLSQLSNVIMAIANNEPHIPYRNSKLTHLLTNSLGGNSKTLMFVNVSPREENLSETLTSLRFATKVNQCNIGTAQKKVK
ncbi:carboxy-terminal kinesin 2-like [Glandiceps talaboti]